MAGESMERDLTGRVALVTGGATRLGRAMVLGLASRGARVAFTYKESKEAASELSAEVAGLAADGEVALAIPCDVRDPAAVTTAFEQLDEQRGPVELLVNNAAVFERTPFDELTLQAWQSHIDVNLTGPLLCAKEAGRRMKDSGHGGLIVNMACSSAVRPWPNYLAYGVSKAGLLMLTQSLAAALAPTVRVNAIAPGPMSLTEDEAELQQRRAESFTALQRAGDATDVVRALLFCWDSDYTTGALIPVDGGRMIL